MPEYYFWLGENNKGWVDLALEDAAWKCYIHRSSKDDEYNNKFPIIHRNVKGEIVYERV